jgi:hypothetical protein
MRLAMQRIIALTPYYLDEIYGKEDTFELH